MIPIDHQPRGYWATNLYASPRKRPKSDAPIKDLPPRAARRFKRAREGIRALRHVTEQVVFMGTAWKWVWMYEVGGRKLGYLHPMETGLSGTFIVTESEERELAVTDGLPRPSRLPKDLALLFAQLLQPRQFLLQHPPVPQDFRLAKQAKSQLGYCRAGT